MHLCFHQIHPAPWIPWPEKQYCPLSVGLMAVSLFAVSNGHLDDVPLKKIGEFEQELHNYVVAKYSDFLDELNIKKDFDDDVASDMTKIIVNFKKLKWIV